MKKEHRVLYGSSEEWIELRARAYINEALSEGWEVEYLDGKKAKKGDISSALKEDYLMTQINSSWWRTLPR